METPSQALPLLNLSNNQKEIIQAHAMSAINNMASIKFNKENQFDAMVSHAYEQGRLSICKALVSYDADQFIAQQEQIHNTSEE